MQEQIDRYKYNMSIDGIKPQPAKRIAQFAFGNYMHSFRVNQKNKSFDLYLYNDVPKDIVNELKEHFGCYKIHYLEIKTDEDEQNEEQQ